MSEHQSVRCCVCGDQLVVTPGEEDVVCHDCYEANFTGGLVWERPTVAHLADSLPARRRDLAALDVARWPLTRGRSEG